MKKKPRKSPGEEMFYEGIALYEASRYDEAIERFMKAADGGFRIDSVENNIGACYERLGQMSKAKAHYETSLLGNPNNVNTLKNMANLLAEEQHWGEAQKLLSRALSFDPEDTELRTDLARVLFRLNRMKRAVRVLRSVFAETTSAEHIIIALYELNEIGLFDEIIDVSKDIPEAIKDIDEVMQLLGKAFLMGGIGDEAKKYFQTLFEREGTPKMKSWLGLAMLSSGDEAVGMNLLLEARDEGGEDTEILQNVVFAFHGSDRLEETIPIYEKLLAKDPNDWVIWNNLGNALYNMGKYTESIPKFVVAIEKNHNYEIAWNNIGNAFEKMELYRESLPYHQIAIDIDGDFDYAYYAKGEALFMTGRYEEAEEAVDKALSLGSTCAESWMLKARILMRSSSEEAIPYAEQAILMEPDSPEPYLLLAICQDMNDMIEESERSLRVAKRLAVENNEGKVAKNIEHMRESGLKPMMKGLNLTAGIGFDDWSVFSPYGKSDTPAYWYNYGMKLLDNGKKRESVMAFRIAFDLDADSPATTAILLRLEANQDRLRKYVSNAERIISKGLSTPMLEESLREVTMPDRTATNSAG